MSKTARIIGATTALLALLYGVRRYYRNWGSTKAESQMGLPGDCLVVDPAIQTTEAVYVDASQSEVWQALSRSFLKTGDLVTPGEAKNPAAEGLSGSDQVHSAPQLSAGNVVRLASPGGRGLTNGVIFSVAEIETNQYIVLNAAWPGSRRDAVWSFHVQPHWEDRVRLLIRARIPLRYPGEVFLLELLRPAIALGTRGLLLGIKHRVERSHMAVAPG